MRAVASVVACLVWSARADWVSRDADKQLSETRVAIKKLADIMLFGLATSSRSIAFANGRVPIMSSSSLRLVGMSGDDNLSGAAPNPGKRIEVATFAMG